jgi:hypothetical protein
MGLCTIVAVLDSISWQCLQEPCRARGAAFESLGIKRALSKGDQPVRRGNVNLKGRTLIA